MEYYLIQNKKRTGPYTLEQINTLELSPEDLIWHEGLDDWKPVQFFQEIKSSKGPPPIPQSQLKTKSKSWSYKTIILSLLTLLSISAIGMFGISKYNEMEYQKWESDLKVDTRRNINDLVKIGNTSYTANELGGIFGLGLIVHNNTQYYLDDVVVNLSYLKPNGTVWKSKDVHFLNVGPYETRTQQVPDTSRGVEVTYEISQIKSKDLELY